MTKVEPTQVDITDIGRWTSETHGFMLGNIHYRAPSSRDIALQDENSRRHGASRYTPTDTPG